MFYNPKLFAISGSVIQPPAQDWTEDTMIYCSFDILIPLKNGKVKYRNILWGTEHAVELSVLIDFYRGLKKYVDNPAITIHVQELMMGPDTFLFIFRNTGDGAKATVMHRFISAEGLQVNEMPLDPVYMNSVYEMIDQFYIKIMAVLAENTSNRLRISVVNKFAPLTRPLSVCDIQQGHKVKTVITKNVKTERVGIVLFHGYHPFEGTQRYYLLVDGQYYSKMYFREDLRPID